jgi:catechol 2,3-dioxygenase-like lactoylglutathione lyase family enzyme
MSDREILEATFKLADAQELVARKEGYANWKALISGEHPMSTTVNDFRAENISDRTIFLASARPCLFVRDVAISCAFYRDALGFRIMASYGQPPYFASVCRDAVWLELRCVEAAAIVDPDLRAREDLLSAIIQLMNLFNLKKLYAQFERDGATFHQKLKKQPWGGHDFIVRDPDGNLIDFACSD